MALATVEVSREHASRVWDEHDRYANYEHQNYVVPNLAPRAYEAGILVQRQPRLTWREAPPPPADPVAVLLWWVIQRPAVALMLAYVLWLGFWSLYALEALSDF
jgi:hypothetical protein